MRPASDILVVIPAFNEAACLPGTIAGLREAQPDLHIVVVDDGSTDHTAEVAESLGVEVLRLPFNLGIGGALRCGFRYAVREGYQRALQFDADGQHDARQIAALLAPLEDGADLVIGCRFSGPSEYRVGRSRRTAMAVLRLLSRWLTGRWFTDTSSGFRAFSRRMLERFADEYPTEYMDSVEALIHAVRAGFDVREVPTVMRERAAGAPSNRRFRLVRGQRVKAKYSLLWLSLGSVLLVMAIFPGMVDRIARRLGVEYEPTLYLVLGMGLLLLVVVHLSYELSRMENRIRGLTEEVTFLRHDLDRRSAEAHDPGS